MEVLYENYLFFVIFVFYMVFSSFCVRYLVLEIFFFYKNIVIKYICIGWMGVWMDV